MTTNPETSLCLQCGKPAADQLVCSGCGVVAPDGSETDYFGVFDLPRNLTIDLDDLERRYYALSREFHPDFFHDRPPAEQAASLRLTAIVNRAYKTLRDPVPRALYWLELHGESLGRDNGRVPPALAARVFAVQEQLEDLRAARARGAAAAERDALAVVRDELRSDLRAAQARLASSFAAGDSTSATALAETKQLVSELHYLRTLLRDVEKEL
ncbi:MAG: Fe-S protein assembly co-chaperone HscB [Polyangiaceae bacterium UTPRO1]|jgi:molecular chaperone HscB|nr:Fe-S protein assembly co-chaperone HscB [Myxococcales bacterium]OQY67792.1 MAG: Fe-S protein assembly co-chaperone HscB [Polyangiaceae bacterium UTPRO1]